MARTQRKDEILKSEVPPVLPLMALRSTIVYPLGTIAVQMGAPENLALLRANDEPGVIVALVVASGDHDEPIDGDKFVGRVGVAARVHERINLPGDTVQITLQGLRRIRIDEVTQLSPFAVARVSPARELPAEGGDVEELVTRIVSAAESLANMVDRIPDEVPAILKMNVSDPGRFADLAATNMNFRIADKDEVLQRLDVAQRLEFIRQRLEREVQRARVMDDVKKQTEIKIEQHQREFYLRQQLRAIQAELGETDPGEKEGVELLRKVDDARLPENVAQEARREIERLRMLSPASSEYQVVRTYLDWVLSLPWHSTSGDADVDIDLKRVEDALGERHYGLNEAKDRIVEYLAVRKLRGLNVLRANAAAAADGTTATPADAPEAVATDEGAPEAVPAVASPAAASTAASNGDGVPALPPPVSDFSAPILCFAGPPGTGKTSLGEVIAKAIGRKFYRISVGGVRDEAEIRGHRRTYVGSMPGLLIQALRRVQVKDPVFLIDEIDKMSGGGPSGDPTAAMLEVLDPSQNQTFVDHYLNLPFDLSQALFICTANNLFDIPGPLRDRMEVIRIAGYTIEEKVEIAWRYTIPKLLEEHGLSTGDIQFTDEVLSFVASRYSREAGLRNFGRHMATLMRKRARRKADGEEGAWVLDRDAVEEVLGPPRYALEEAEKEAEVGAVTGLAWTSTGGDLMGIEALRMPGTGRLTVTGQLGDVMRESVDAAFSYVRSRADVIGIDAKEFKESDVHIHFPAGAIPKDGPSAGLAITLAVASVLSRRPVRRDLAMTGEVTLRGKALEIGGVKEKVLAAYRAGLREVILPKSNEKDLRDVPKEVREAMTFTAVTSMDEVLRIALLPAPSTPPDRQAALPSAPLADGADLAVGENARAPGAREEVPLADVARADVTR
jgi:ATP-dependent Lon protease